MIVKYALPKILYRFATTTHSHVKYGVEARLYLDNPFPGN